MLSIGELAHHAGVTVRTVRHYHQLGLLPEPGRDEAGHRRYPAEALVQLRRVTTLAGAGVPLRRIPMVLAASPERRGALLDELDEELARRQEQLVLTRRRLHELRTDADVATPPALTQLQRRLTELGMDDEHLQRETEVWHLTHVLYPEQAERWLDQQLTLLSDPEYVTLYQDVLRSDGCDPDDPVLEELAKRNVAWTVSHLEEYLSWSRSWQDDPRAGQVLEAHFRERYQSPAHRRLQSLVQRRLAEELDHMPSEKVASRSALA